MSYYDMIREWSKGRSVEAEVLVGEPSLSTPRVHAVGTYPQFVRDCGWMSCGDFVVPGAYREPSVLSESWSANVFLEEGEQEKFLVVGVDYEDVQNPGYSVVYVLSVDDGEVMSIGGSGRRVVRQFHDFDEFVRVFVLG